jgi:hypothetical protein
MGTFNILKTTIACANCKVNFEVKIQFKYGDTWQHTFGIADDLKWGGNDVGSPVYKKVVVYGITGKNICPNCNAINHEEFDILMIDNKIHSIKPMSAYQNYLMDTDGSFYIINE